MDSRDRRVLLIDPDDARRRVLVRRLKAQGYEVEEASDAVRGADIALSAPPLAVIAELWMPTASGVQLCRLLRGEPATADVPIILCGDDGEPRNRFWAERAGATSYVIHGRTGDLVRALARVLEARAESDAFFVQLSGGSAGILNRIARHLDVALFESVIAAELRSLASCGSFERLFDSLAQLTSQLTRYRWIALSSNGHFAVHHHPQIGPVAEKEARAALGLTTAELHRIEDEDAAAEPAGPAALVREVLLGDDGVARFALGPRIAHEPHESASLADIIARELGGPVRMAALVEEAQLLARMDSLTALMNRRAFLAAMTSEHARAARYGHPLTLAMLDVDRFKVINDEHGHAVGDKVLAALGTLVGLQLRETDLAARWGGEELVLAFTSTGLEGGRVAAERIREAIRMLIVLDDQGTRVPVTASIGVAELRAGESLEGLLHRADRAMYASKAAGRNRVTMCDDRGPLFAVG
jgi:two-component system, cell cycle response regulator